MKTASKLLCLGLWICTACSSTGRFSSPTPTLSPSPVTTDTRVPPTPSSPGDSVIWRDLQVNMLQAELTASFINEFGSQRLPSAGKQFLWIHVALENLGKDEIPVPESENFSVLYADSEFKPVYGHRQGYADYTSLESTLFPGDKLDAWLRFDIPDTASLNQLWFVFLPTSAQVGSSPLSPDYPYATTKPTYVWQCAP